MELRVRDQGSLSYKLWIFSLRFLFAFENMIDPKVHFNPSFELILLLTLSSETNPENLIHEGHFWWQGQ
jgi:hypothetical protein